MQDSTYIKITHSKIDYKDEEAKFKIWTNLTRVIVHNTWYLYVKSSMKKIHTFIESFLLLENNKLLEKNLKRLSITFKRLKSQRN